MPIKVTCNSCAGVLHAPDDSAGKRGRCPTCGAILAIPADGARVAEAPSMPPPQPAAPFGAPSEPLAFPKPPAFGAPEPAKPAFGPSTRSSTAPGALASRLPPDPRKGMESPATPPASARSASPAAAKWQRAASGLGMVRTGLVLIVLAVLIPTVIAILEQNGVPLPEKDPGILNAQGLSLANEIKAGAALALLALGGLLITLGRFRFAAVPRESGAKGLAFWAMVATVAAFTGFLVTIGFAISGTTAGAPPKLVPHPDVLAPQAQLQFRIEGYVKHLLLDASDLPGMAQRYGMLAFLVFGGLAEVWFLGALGRTATSLRREFAVGRVTRFVVLMGLIIAVVLFGALWFDLDGRRVIATELQPKWDALAPGVKIAVRAGVTGFIVLVLLYNLARAVGGVRLAIRESLEPGT
jgi:hypothetical protein